MSWVRTGFSLNREVKKKKKNNNNNNIHLELILPASYSSSKLPISESFSQKY
jgi:hypothetical protein